MKGKRPTISVHGEVGRQVGPMGKIGRGKHAGFVQIATLAEAVIKDVIRKRR